jgi:hypothetical protein
VVEKSRADIAAMVAGAKARGAIVSESDVPTLALGPVPEGGDDDAQRP